MKTLRTLARIMAVALIVSLVFSFAACNLLKGSLKLEAFVVDRNSVKTVYFLGEEIDFSGIKATVRYSDESLNKEYTFDELTITYNDDITATVGTKQVKVSFMDPHLETEQVTYVQITVKEDPNAIKHASYAVDSSAMKTTYFVGEAIDFTGIKIIEKFTNGGADVEMTDLTLISYDYSADTITATTGTKTIVVNYNGESAGSVSVTVKYPAQTSFTLNTDSFNSYYMVGDTLDLSGLTATVTYENGVSKTVTEFTADNTSVGSAGTKTVIINYVDPVSGATATTSVDITVDAVENYVLDTTGMTLTYFEGDTVSFAGIKVTAQYYFAADEELAFEDLTFVHDDDLTATSGNKVVEVMVGNEKAGEFVVQVGDIIATPTLGTDGVKTAYKQGETLDLTGLTLTITYNDPDVPSKEGIALSELILPADLAALTATGTQNGKDVTVQIRYEDDVTGIVITNLTIKVYSPIYSVSSAPAKVEYYKGQTLDFAGLEVSMTYKHLDGFTETVDASRVTVGATIADVTGPKAVLVDGEQIGTITITVNKNAIASATVSGYASLYEYNETIDFKGLTVTVVYLDGTTLTLDIAKLTVGAVDSSVPGKKVVSVTFTDEVNAESYTTSFETEILEPKKSVTAFEKPDTLTAFDSDNKDAGTASYGDSNFAGQFALGGKLYVIGDDNAFVMIPTVTVDEDGMDKDLDKFFADVDLFIWDGAKYVLAEKSANSLTNYTYTVDGATVATVDVYNGEYTFAKPFEKVKISVMPSAQYYNNTESFNPVVLEAQVIDAYNVYNAKQLSVIDTSDRQEWTDYKALNGLSGINPAGVVLHNDVSIKYTDVPEAFFYKSDASVTYYNNVTGDHMDYANKTGMNYLADYTVLYDRIGPADFVIQGNFFTISAADFPLVASPSIFGTEAEKDYGTDYSNSALFRFETILDNYVSADKVPDKAIVTIENVAFIGNAGRDSWTIELVKGEEVSSPTELVTAGGLILVKSTHHAITTFNNVINNCFFISYMPDYEGTINLNSVKCYDSYQNAAFVWSDSIFEVKDSYFNGTGGPVIIAQSVEIDGIGYLNPQTNLTNTKVDTALSGEEIWFKAVGATAVVPQIKSIGGGLEQLINGAGKMINPALDLHANILDANGKMNIEGALMNNAKNAGEALTDIHVQGNILTDGTGINRWNSGDNADPVWATVYYAIVSGANPDLAKAPILVTYDATGAPQVLIYNGNPETGFCDINGNDIGTDLANQAAIIQNFATADEVVLYMGGLSILFELYH